MNFPRRPDHPDFWLISQAVTDADVQSDSGEPVQPILERYVDVASATYVASQRAIRALDATGLPEGLMVVIAGAWLDGFGAGIRFQHLKTTGAHELSDEDIAPPPTP